MRYKTLRMIMMKGSTALLALLLACLWHVTWATRLPFRLGAAKSPARSSTSLQDSNFSMRQVAKKVSEDFDRTYGVHVFDLGDGSEVITFWAKGLKGTYRVIAVLDESKQEVTIYTKSAISVPKNRRDKVAEYLTRLNYRTIIGDFEMNCSNGEVWYRRSMDVTGGKLEPSMFLIVGTIRTMDVYHAGLMAVVYSDMSPSEAIDELSEEAELNEFIAPLQSIRRGLSMVIQGIPTVVKNSL